MIASTDCWLLFLKEVELHRPLIIRYRLLKSVASGLDCCEVINPAPNFSGQSLFLCVAELGLGS